jgi:parallel beta-helix repeat protein
VGVTRGDGTLTFTTKVVMNESSFLRKRGEVGHGRRQATRTTSRLLAALIALFLLGLAASSGTSAAVGTTFTVDTTDGTTDEGCGGASDCSFGDAIEAANANPGKDTIAFGIPGAGTHLIVLSDPFPSPSPFVADAVVIDGFSQGGPAYSGTPLVEIDTSGWGGFGLAIRGEGTGGTEIRGLALHGGAENNDVTIFFDNPGGNVVEHNFIGTDASGMAVEGGGLVHMGWGSPGDGFVSSANMIADNVIAGTRCCIQFNEVSDSQVVRNNIGTDASGLTGLANGSGAVGIFLSGGGDRNLFSGNVIARMFIGIWLLSPSSDTRIEGNRIGTDKTGTVDLGNSSAGVFIHFAGTHTIVGGPDPAAQNVISGNGDCGICIEASGETVVQGNLIGTDITGTSDLGNDDAGISVCCTGAAGNEAFPLIADNVISGNNGQGIAVNTIGSARIERNLIGTDAQGTAAIPNDGAGIEIGFESDGSVIGGASAAQRNVISGNGGNGVEVFGAVTGLQVLNNYIGTNKAGDGDLGNAGAGVFLGGHDITIGRPGAGNLISGNAGAGVRLSGDGAVVQGNLIGTNVSGDEDLGNEGAGVLGAGDFDAKIGGAAAGERNIISGNAGWGIQLLAGGGASVIERNRIGTNAGGGIRLPNALGGIDMARGAPFDIVANLISGNGGDGVRAAAGLFTSNRVIGNFIGTDASGVSDLGNAGNGVHLLGEVGGAIVVGGTTPGDRNVISGNGQNGVLHESSVRHDIVGNYIGTDLQGANGIPNDLSGVRLDGSTTVRGNVVSGNGLDGIELHSSRNEVRGNLVGTGANGASPLGNSRHGVSIDGGGAATENTVGGPEGDGNTIAFNGEHGISIQRASLNLVKRNEIFSNGGDGVAVIEVPPFGAVRNTISENAISSNTGLGIDLGDDRVTPNDPADGDGGANFLQNFPENIQVSADGTTVTGELHSISDRSYTIEVFENTSCDPSGFGEGEGWIGSTDMSTAGGNSSFSILLSSPVAAGSIVTATATDADGNTSEFSPCVEVPESATIFVEKSCQPAGDPGSFNLQVNGTTLGAPASCGQSRSATLTPGTYTVSESGAAGTNLADYETSIGGACNGQGQITLAAGQSATCTITNVRKATLTIHKSCQPANDTGSFNLRIDGSTVGAAASCGDDRTTKLSPGSYTIDETGAGGTNLSDYDSTIGGACAANGSITLSASQSATCTITNVREATLTVNKACQPTSDTGRFVLAVNPGNHTNEVGCGGSLVVQLSPGSYTVSETAGPGTNLSDYDRTIGGACAANGSVTLRPDQSASCTVTNRRKPQLTVTKLCPNGKQSPEDRFEVTLNGTRTGRIVGVPETCGDSTTFVPAPSTQTVSEAVPAGNTTTNLQNYVITRGGDCNSSGSVTLTYGDTKTCTITNTRRARSQPFTPGYWKNHRSQTVALLPVMLGNYVVTNFNQASGVFDAMNCGASTDQSAVGCLAGHLLAAKLNVKNGSDNCINSWIAQGDVLLVSINYIDPGGTYTLTPTQRTQFLAVKDALDTYNNGRGC